MKEKYYRVVKPRGNIKIAIKIFDNSKDAMHWVGCHNGENGVWYGIYSTWETPEELIKNGWIIKDNAI